MVAELIVWYLVFVFSTTCHEAAHAYLAFRGGDLTAYEGGQVTLDPTPHIRRSPFGMVVIPLFSFLYVGWMIGWASTPFDPEWGRRHPKRQALMSLAGPAANLLLAAIALVAIRALIAANVFEAPRHVGYSRLVEVPGSDGRSALAALAMALSVMLNLNVLLGLFNLMPIPPLDGAGVVQGISPRHTVPLYDRLRETPLMQMVGLLIAWKLFSYLAGPAFSLTLWLVHPNVLYR
jgi:Zn-dependent protease